MPPTNLSPQPDPTLPYPAIPAQPSFPALEQEILAFWDADRTFEASIDRRAGADEFVFYD